MLHPGVRLTEFKGMNNRLREEEIPEGYLRNAVNVLFDNRNKARLIPGVMQVYSGENIHSFWRGYFIEGEDLKFIDSSYSVSTVIADVGSNRMVYTQIDDRVYCSNGVESYIVDGISGMTWGLEWPEYQPILTARTSGGFPKGEYQVAVTWLRAQEESGCGPASTITLTDGQGILATLPNVPLGITGIAVYVSSTNDDGLYLYNEYPRTADKIYIDYDLSTTPLETQFMFRPGPTQVLQEHYGRIYWADGPLVRYTEPQRYSFSKGNNFWRFEGEVKIIASVPGSLYVVCDKTYRVVNIDAEGFPSRIEMLPYGGVKGSLFYDTINQTAYWLSERGIVAATAEGVRELVYDNVVLPEYELGTLSMMETAGTRILLSVARGGVESSFTSKDYRADEIARKGNAL